MEVFELLVSIDTVHCTEWPYALTDNGYGAVQVGANIVKLHALSCERTHGPRPEGMEAAHHCGNRRCINPQHIRWATPAENQADRLKHGTANIGSRNPLAKLREDDIPVIRLRLANGESQAKIAADYGVQPYTISNIKRGVTWSQAA